MATQEDEAMLSGVTIYLIANSLHLASSMYAWAPSEI